MKDIEYTWERASSIEAYLNHKPLSEVVQTANEVFSLD